MRSWRVWVGVAAVLGLVAGGLVASAGASSTGAQKPTVTPSTGQPRGTFHLSFTAPRPTGVVNGLQSAIEMTAQGPARTGGCLASIEQSATAVRKDETVHLTLSPGRRSWCGGRFRGSISESGRPVCKPNVPCPQFIELTPIGTFSFVVRR